MLMQIFLMWQIQKLVNKIMSRNYTDYVQSQPIPQASFGHSQFNGETDLGPDESGIMSDIR